MTRNIFIVEDDLSYFVELKLMLKELGLPLIGHAENSTDAIGKIIELNPDFILMDIDIKGNLKGTEVAKKIEHLNIPILFITSFANESNYREASKCDNFLFMSKPIQKYTLLSALAKLENNNPAQTPEQPSSKEEEEEFYYIRKKNTYHKVLLSEILFVSSEGNYCKFITEDKSYIERITLNKVEAKLPEQFIRCHRGFIVNLNMVDSFSVAEQTISVRQNIIPMSASMKTHFDQILHEKGIINSPPK